MIEAYIYIAIAEERATKTRVISLPSVTWVVRSIMPKAPDHLLNSEQCISENYSTTFITHLNQANAMLTCTDSNRRLID